ncbi:uncharacterized protein LOC126332765 isoform X2 [Schistocerca gregaria]|uniref:uncharacterized protein LOC126332765 isoform X2 n=1 Tax=Schistocerca gregaria TaxID=7010 RepID=UPI00211DC81A|nr:uncharacterized protein LOC126332765 isoform X2 [Schistocerca gregaria]
MEEDIEVDQQSRRQVKYRDVPMLILFVLAIGYYLGYGIYIGVFGISSGYAWPMWENEKFEVFMIHAAIAIVVALCIIPITIKLLKNYAREMIIASFTMLGIMFAGVAIVSLMLKLYVSSVLAFISLALIIMVYYTTRKRMDFTVQVLKVSARVMTQSYGVVVMNMVSIFLLLASISVLFMFVAGVATYYSEDVRRQPPLYYDFEFGFFGEKEPAYNNLSTIQIFSHLLILFCFYWIVQYIRYQHYTVICGYMATWYYMHGNMPSKPVYNSFVRANTTSCGSVAFGSMVVTVLSLIRAAFRDDDCNSFAGALGAFCFSIIEQIVRYANSYCFCYISTYGKSYISSVKSFYNMCKRTKLGLLAQDVPISYVIAVIEVFVTVVSCVVAGAIVTIFTTDYAATLPYLFINLVITYTVTSIATSSVEAGVKTFFVCFFEEPSVLRARNPDFYQIIINTYGSSVIAPVDDA